MPVSETLNLLIKTANLHLNHFLQHHALAAITALVYTAIYSSLFMLFKRMLVQGLYLADPHFIFKYFILFHWWSRSRCILVPGNIILH